MSESYIDAYKALCQKNNYIFSEDEFERKFFERFKTLNTKIDDLDAAIEFTKNKFQVDNQGVAEYIFNWITKDSTVKKLESALKSFKFNNSRNCCLAPLTTINFDTLGTARVCCYNSTFTLGTYPDNTINELWNNKKRYQFIDQLKQKSFPTGCSRCKLQAATGNISNALFSNFDKYDNNVSDYPIALEFEFGNICNYECIMCGGKWSSSIRKNREKLPPLNSPYDDNFILQLTPFLRHAKILNFLGGEPFLTPLYYKIWDILKEIKSLASIFVTTNGSILTDKVKKYIDQNNLSLIVSLDSLDKNCYEFIRKNSNFNLVMNNINFLLNEKRLSSIAFCPMIQNIKELPNIVNFCIEKNIGLFLNTVIKPLGGPIKGIHSWEKDNEYAWISDTRKDKVTSVLNNEIPPFSLHQLNSEELEDIILFLQNNKPRNIPETINGQYDDLIKSLQDTKKAVYSGMPWLEGGIR